jgi:hypothetical protein
MYCSPNIIRMIISIRMSWAGYVAHVGERRNTYRISLVEPEGNRPLVRPRCRCEDNCLMFIPCIIRLLEETNNMHWLYHSFILRTGSYMFRQ